MIILAFLFLLLAFILFLLFTTGQSFKLLRGLGIIASVALLLLYFFVKNFELSSTPILTRTTNKTNESFEVYYISFYNGLSHIVSNMSDIKPKSVSEEQFEVEGVTEIWMVAVDENDRVSYFKKNKNPWTSYLLEYAIENKNSSYEAGDKNKALSIIKKFNLNRIFEKTLLFGSLVLLLTLIIKKKKTIKQ